jgi:hypothetical protein
MKMHGVNSIKSSEYVLPETLLNIYQTTRCHNPNYIILTAKNN